MQQSTTPCDWHISCSAVAKAGHRCGVCDAGVAVSSMMLGTTVLMYFVMLMIWETNIFLATAFLYFFGFIDMVYTTGETNLPAPSSQLTSAVIRVALS